MFELVIHVPSYIGPSYLEVDEFGWAEWVQGITKADVEMQVEWAKMMGDEPTSILLEISTCDGGSTTEGFAIYNYLRGLGLPIRVHILSLACSMAVPLALVGDQAPEMEYTAQLMIHSAAFNSLIYAPTSTDLRSQADRLDNTNQLLTDLLIARTGQAPEVVAEWMSKDTWLTATQAQAVGLCSKVIPLTSATTPVQADSLITARRKRATEVLARRAKTDPQAKTPAAPAPVPMATTPKPTPRAAAKPAAKPAAQPQARGKNAFTRFMDWLEGESQKEDAEAAGGTTEPTAEVQTTDLANGAKVYHDGDIVVGTTAIFNDDALTEATADGDYDTADEQVLTVAGGICTTLGADPNAVAETPAVARLRADMQAMKTHLDTVTAERDRLRAAKPMLPAPVARVRTDAPDPKTQSGKPTGATHHTQL